jgi:hypothetical protein
VRRRRWRYDDAGDADIYKYAGDGGGGRDDIHVSGDGEFAGQERDHVCAERRAHRRDTFGKYHYVDADACGVASSECVYGEGDDGGGWKRGANVERDAEREYQHYGCDLVLGTVWGE